MAHTMDALCSYMYNVPLPFPLSRSLSLSLPLRVNQVLKQNDHLKSQLQAQLTTYQPSATSAGALGCDSSGVVTSAVCYQLRGEVQQVREEKGKLEARVTKLKTESQKKLELYNKEK